MTIKNVVNVVANTNFIMIKDFGNEYSFTIRELYKVLWDKRLDTENAGLILILANKKVDMLMPITNDEGKLGLFVSTK